MRIQKFSNENWDDLESAVLEETPSPGQKLGVSETYSNQCLARRMKRADKPLKDTVHHAHRGLLHRGWSVIALGLMILFTQASIATAGPASDHRQSVRSCRNHRHRCSRALGPRWLHAVVEHASLRCESVASEQAAVRCPARLHADHGRR